MTRRDATVASRREISYTRLLIRNIVNREPPRGGGVLLIKVISSHVAIMTCHYGVATCSRLLEMIGLFCKRAL